ncbi:MAG: alkaline phosphatase family protein, partial [Actinomycetes bacterium]
GASGLRGAAAAGAQTETRSFPHYDHVFTLIEENHGFTDIIGNPEAPTLNSLAHQYGLATQYYGVTHPSGPNYVAMLGGGTFGVNSDDPYWNFHVNQPSLMSQMEAAGQSWKGYLQGLPYPGYRGYCYPVRCLGVPDSDTQYIAKHNGLVYFHSVNANPAELAKMQPLGRLGQDLDRNQVPNLSYIVPDECTDMHGAPPVCVDSGNPRDLNDNRLVATADAFVGRTVQRITHAPVWAHGNNAIVIAFDEGTDNTGCCTANPGGGRALSIVVTNHGGHGITDSTPYNHYGLLSSLQHAFGLGCLAASCNQAAVKPMTPLFAADPHSPVSVPAPVAPAPTTGATPTYGGPQTATGAAAPGPTPGHWQTVPTPNLS